MGKGVILSEREHQVLARLAAGQTQVEIAEVFGVAPSTVSGYIQRAARKLDNSRTAAAAVAVAVARGLITPVRPTIKQSIALSQSKARRS